MKLVIDEKLKHRLIGLAVIVSLVAIFAPAVMKKSSQNLVTNYSVHVRLPPKPSAPNVVMSDEKELFETIKVAKVHIPEVSSESQLPELATMEAIKSDSALQPIHELASNADNKEQAALNESVIPAIKSQAKIALKAAVVKAAPVVAVIKKPALKINKAIHRPIAKKVAVKALAKADIYAVQLASFAQLANAQALVNKLHSKGYKASFTRIKGQQGPIYKVYAGHSSNKTAVLKVKTQLASAMQLNGFIVNTRVS